MYKVIVLAALIGIATCQMQNLAQMMMMQSLMSGGGAGAGNPGTGTAAAGSTGSSSASAANPQAALLCRQTDNFRPIPCRTTPFVCDMLSMRSYNMPGLLTCSPMGFGCCIKDMMSLFMVQRNA